MLLFFLFGIGLAFFPLQDRPLEKWIVLFFKSIYSPTQFHWDDSVTQRAYFRPEEDEIQRVEMAQAQAQTLQPQTGTPQVPQQPGTPQPQNTGVLYQAAVPVNRQQKQQINIPQMAPTPVTEQEKESVEAMGHLEQQENAFLSRLTDHFRFAAQNPAPQPVQTQIQKDKQVEIPVVNSITIDQKNIDEQKKQEEAHKLDSGVTTEELASVTSTVAPAMGSGSLSEASAANFSTAAAPPIPPTRANIIVGQVLDATGKIVDGAILEIRDQDGRPVRALRTNQLGHFSIVTPLVEGSYQIVTEKEGLNFEPLVFQAKNEIIPAITIRANTSSANTGN